MLRHSEFVEWLYKTFPNTDKSLMMKIVIQTNVGVAPEASYVEAQRVAELIFTQQGNLFKPIPTLIPAAPPPQLKPKFVFGEASQTRLIKLMPELHRVVTQALSLSTVDFMVMQTTRSAKEQAAAVQAGNSRTMHSKHLIQPDGFAHACDLGVYKDGKIDWTFEHYAAIALAMDKAATLLNCANHVRWGCAWDRVLSDFGGSEQAYLDEAKAYANRHVGTDLLDAPHFEWVP